ncbi:MAG: 3-phosphoshikimate 1-carboxyvinyltransferase [Lentisphaerae bacterium GWF2_52_8]|nr:MAG: 3-phosphoshikimate 1-carboxyvinyltransferase [Lentisphaerae bacterium GWF2_52_8]
MKLKVTPSRVNGTISVPGSKSHSIRAVAIACMASGESVIRAPLISEDTISCVKAARAFGAEISMEDGVWRVKGTGGKLHDPKQILDMGNSGTSLRIFSGLAATAPFPVRFDGDSSLRTRLMAPLLSGIEQLGAKTSSTNGKCPLSIHGPMHGGSAEIEGNSSQFVSAMLFAAPLLAGNTKIHVSNLNEKPYVEITIDWLRKQEIQFANSPDFSFFEFKGGQQYKPFSMSIPADFSTATFPLVAAAVTRGKVRIMNLDFSDRQGDKAVFEHLAHMGAVVERGPEWTEVFLDHGLHGVQLDLNATPDALPALAVAACFAEGRTILGNVPQARIKETDRIACMTRELRKMGAQITELQDGMIIDGSPMRGADLESHGDHRIAMALAIAGLAAEGESRINAAECAAVTYPDFVADFQKIGAKFTPLGD